ncbi:uncharacterized protein EV154DRAFT_549276 [Mucor mucedo]|uniref:uncharacterized protein n=1 Tax=Mucor mucedo TaxID=29922 RepID=UPI002220603A|nr:uncharacterized protein EV154DRAFT_549276 [Mucor mucedo]KAI7894076.1 hypothetical protein EV154DRAFT_549276 [Mucor mucedo]
MPQKKRQAIRRSEPKLFRCTGFGICDMVFTRSEHLARHARKHTGEKPFQCAVSDCNRMFSRFDNMMQHTQTHSRTKKKDSNDDTLSAKEDSPMPVPQPKMYNPNTRMLPPHMYYQPMSPPSPTTSEQYHTQLQRPWPVYHSPQFHQSDMMLRHPNSPPVLHSVDTWYPNSPVESNTHKRRLSHVDLSTPIQELGTRADSSDDDEDDERQMSPISLDDCSKTRFRYAGVDITVDEYEALQGFGKFCAEPVVNETIRLPPLNSIYTGPHAFRQHITTVQESFQRGAH